MDQVRLGVIGIGGMARSHMKSFGDVPGVKFVAAADPSESARAHAAEYGVKVFEDGNELIGSGLVDAVLIATPHYFHPPYAIAAFKQGLHVLTEKPIGVTAKAAQEMIDEADRHPELVFGAMFQMRVNPLWREVKRIIDSGAIGRLHRVSWTITIWFRTQAYYDSGGWRATWSGEGGGVLINQCPHNLDLFQWLVGLPKRVTAQVGLGKYHDIEVEDEVNALLEFENGATGTFITSTAEAPGVNRLEIVGEDATLIAEAGEIKLLRNHAGALAYSKTTTERFAKPPHDVQTIKPGGRDAGHLGITRNFINAILHGEKLIAPARDGIRGLELGNAMLMSGIRHKPVDLPTDREAFDALIQELIANSTFEKKEVAATAGDDLASSFVK
ncbi:MAG: Gfo/Idh/MocA family oxidoreductase [Phycisphaeraceae bacterium]